MENLSKLPYSDLAVEILLNFCSENLSKDELRSLIQDAYKNFEDKEVVRIKKIGNINLRKGYGENFIIYSKIQRQRLRSLSLTQTKE